MKQKINLRLTLIAIIAVFSAAVGCTLVYYHLFQNQVFSDLLNNARLLEASGLFDDDSDLIPEDSLRDFDAEALRITWISADGTVLYDNDADASVLENHLNRPEIKAAMANGEGSSVRQSETLGMNTFYCAIRLDSGCLLRVSVEAKSIISIFISALPVIFALMAIIAAVCILIGHLLTAQLLEPINKMAEHVDEPDCAAVYPELQPFADRIRMQHEGILAAAKSRQDFTANISHELKTPLTSISGYAELIEVGLAEPDQVSELARKIINNATRLLSLINDIIRLSELDHEEEMHVVPSDLLKIAVNCCENMQVNARERKITLTCGGSPAPLSCDPELIHELISNLVQNGIRYNNEGGYVHVHVSISEGHAQLEVRDNGIGIPEDQQDRIFERFYRVDKSRSRETGGTGLGLSIVKHIALLHHASIQVHSSPGSGTVMTVSF